MKPLFLFRPEPGWTLSAQTAGAMGLDVHGAPLFSVEPVPWDAPDPADFGGILVGSANVFRHGGAGLKTLQRLPVHAVGQATADAARGAGFIVGQTGSGGLQRVVDALDGREIRLLRLAGEDRVALSAPDGIAIETRVVYRAIPRPLAGEGVEKLRIGGVAALHSGAAAVRLAAECDLNRIDRSLVDIAAIGPRVAEMAGEGWRSVHIADGTGDSELLALAKSLCQNL